MTLPTLFISVTGLLARLSEEQHCCRLTALCLVLSLCTHSVGVYLKHSRLRFYKDPDSARAFHRGLHKFMSHETPLLDEMYTCVYILIIQRPSIGYDVMDNLVAVMKKIKILILTFLFVNARDGFCLMLLK